MPTEAAIREHLQAVLGSRRFERAGQLRALLTFLVEETLAGRGDALKEYVIGTQALGRHPAFDPQHDPIVRVQVRQLRARLDAYYADDGRVTAIRISVPKGAYAAVFTSAGGTQGASPSLQSRWRWPWPTATLAGALTGVMLAVVALRDNGRPPSESPARHRTPAAAQRGATAEADGDARVSRESRELYQRGRVLWNQRTSESLAFAIGVFEQAIARDPAYAEAHAALAATYAVMEFNGITPPGRSAPKARLAATRALALDPRSSLALAVLAGMASFADRDWARSNALFERAAAIESADATVLHWYGTNLIALGRFDDAIAILRRARALDPRSMPIAYSIGEAYLYARRPEPVIEHAEAMLRDDATYLGAHDLLSRAYAAQGRWDSALQEAERCSWSTLRSAIVLARAGRRAEARALAAALERTDLPARVPYAIAGVHAQLGDREATFHWLQLASRLGQADLVTLNVDPWFDPVRDDARFAALVRALGLTPAAAPAALPY